MKKIKKTAWAITDWGGGIKHLSVSIFDTKKKALKELKRMEKWPDPCIKGEPNKIIKVEVREIK